MEEPSESRGKEPLAAAVARGLRESIMDGRLQPNDRIKQDTVAQQFGVSRSTVREAFLELASEGFIELERDVGARVSPMDIREVEQLYLAREALEPMLIALAARQITAEDLARATAINERSETLARRGDVAGYLKLDGDFHQILLQASGHDLLCDMALGLWHRTNRYRFAYLRPSRIEISILEHQMILDAIGRGAGEDAADLYRVHTRRTRETLLALGLPDIRGPHEAVSPSAQPSPEGTESHAR